MDAIEKALARLREKERARIKDIFKRLIAGDVRGLDIKKLKGRDDIFRVRKGDLRILYRTHDSILFILTIERRNEKTYR